jgi:hypothetical protein
MKSKMSMVPPSRPWTAEEDETLRALAIKPDRGSLDQSRSASALERRSLSVWARGKMKNPLRNETLMLAFVSGILAYVLTLALRAAISG